MAASRNALAIGALLADATTESSVGPDRSELVPAFRAGQTAPCCPPTIPRMRGSAPMLAGFRTIRSAARTLVSLVVDGSGAAIARDRWEELLPVGFAPGTVGRDG